MRRLASLAAPLLVLVLAAAAPAQTPGDEQYTDPFGGQQDQDQGQDGGGSQPEPEPEEPEPQEPPAAAAPEPATSAPEPSPTPAAATAVAAEQQLPRTGAEAGLLALGGTLLLASGLALRTRLSERAPRRR